MLTNVEYIYIYIERENLFLKMSKFFYFVWKMIKKIQAILKYVQ